MPSNEGSTSEIIERWREEERRPVVGWDWSGLAARRSESPLPWDYEACVGEAVRTAGALLDLGTGGGEALARSCAAMPKRSVATEGYRANAPVAAARLAPLGTSVLLAGRALPLRSESFDLVTNRQAGYDAAEVARVLRPGGRYLTQQIDSSSRTALREPFGRHTDPERGSLRERRQALADAGLEILHAREHTTEVRYEDVSALVCHLSGMPWAVPGFSVERDLDALLSLHERWCAGVPLCFPRRILLLEARRP